MAFKMCRLCCENDATFNIFSNGTDDIGLFEKIMYCCSNVNIKEGDGLPSHACGRCERELAACYRFVLRCEEADRQLRESLTVPVAQVTAEFHDLKPKAEVKTELNDDLDDHQFEDIENTGIELDAKQNELEIKVEQKLLKQKTYKMRKKYKRTGCKCSVCGRLCASSASLTIHMRSHTNEKPYSCQSCAKSYKDSGTLKRHIERNHLEKRPRNFICEHCGKGFYSKSCVKIHMRIHTGETPYSCTECPARFTQLGALLRHKKRHTGQKDHICPTCAKQFCTKQELNTHLSSVHTNTDKNYACPICRVTIKHKTNLRKHIQQHSEQASFVCNYCGRTFNTKGNLKTHIDRKHSEKSGHCSVCSKSVSNIEAHMWRHTGERPLKCDLCSSSFYELRALTHHMNFKHKMTDKYKCEREGCSMSFPSRPMLTVHTAKFHSTKIPFPCDRCSRAFYRKSDLARHKLGTHKEKLLQSVQDATSDNL